MLNELLKVFNELINDGNETEKRKKTQPTHFVIKIDVANMHRVLL